MSRNFAAIVADARRFQSMTAAEMDYSLATGDGTALAALAEATYRIANGHAPVVQPGDGVEVLQQRQARADALRDATAAELAAMVTAAKAKRYVGWSNASRGAIRYAH